MTFLRGFHGFYPKFPLVETEFVTRRMSIGVCFRCYRERLRIKRECILQTALDSLVTSRDDEIKADVEEYANNGQLDCYL